MTFKPVVEGSSAPVGPLELFDELPRRPGAIPELWRQQGEILAEYAKRFEKKRDVAVELPTGTGKTLVGLLIADWRRRQYRKPVLYACPTQQLVHQVATVAQREGMPSVTLIGSHRSWPSLDKSEYDGAGAMALTTYSSIFNAAPKVGTPGTIVFDDAHAAEHYVAESWAVTINRGEHPEVYDAFLNALRPALSSAFAGRMQHATPDVRALRDVQLVVPLRWPQMAEAINGALQQLPNGSSAWWAWNTVNPGLASCFVYVSWHEMLLRPFIPPTSENEPFSHADQRVYLSATPGHAGELERSFGRKSIDRLLLSDGRSPRSGRRFFVFAELAQGDGVNIAARATMLAGKALVLAPSTELAHAASHELNVNNWLILGKKDIERNLEAFTGQQQVILALAGRYDGIDLPDQACRLVCLTGLPEWTHLQERFLSSNLRARATLEERTRSRVVQGSGRATRNPLDHAVVLIQGDELTRYLSSPIRRRALDADLQAEIEFGLKNSRGIPLADLLNNVSIFLEQADEWRNEAEPLIAEARRNASRQNPEESSLLATSAPHEVDAWTSAFRSDFVGAREAAQKAAAALSGCTDVQPYRTFWLYQAYVWSLASANGDPNANKTASGLLKDAHKAARGTTWLREVEAGAQLTVEEDANDTPAVRTLAKRLCKMSKKSAIKTEIVRTREGLSETEHRRFEPALTGLGRLLGAESSKPSAPGRADCVWCWEDRVWIAIEAKSEQSPSGEISLQTIRQVNPHMSLLAEDRGVGMPTLAAMVVASPRTAVADEAVTSAQSEVFLVHPKAFGDICEDAEQCWDELLRTHRGHTGRDLDTLVRKTMTKHQVLPTQVFERLTSIPIKS